MIRAVGDSSDPGRQVGKLANELGISLAFETGQETADLLRLTLDELKAPNLKVNFDPANMLLYDMGDPIRAVEILGPDIQSVHVKDARRPRVPGQWGEEVPLGQGEVNIPKFVQALKRIGYTGPLVIEREVGDQAGRFRDVAAGLRVLSAFVTELTLERVKRLKDRRFPTVRRSMRSRLGTRDNRPTLSLCGVSEGRLFYSQSGESFKILTVASL